MASILAAEFAATVLGAPEALVIGGTSPLLWRHVAYGEERSAGKTKNKDPWYAGVKIEVKLELFAYIRKLERAPQAAQMQFCSSSSSATTIADDGHRPIHLIASNPREVTVTGPALRTVVDDGH